MKAWLVCLSVTSAACAPEGSGCVEHWDCDQEQGLICIRVTGQERGTCDPSPSCASNDDCDAELGYRCELREDAPEEDFGTCVYGHGATS